MVLVIVVADLVIEVVHAVVELTVLSEEAIEVECVVLVHVAKILLFPPLGRWVQEDADVDHSTLNVVHLREEVHSVELPLHRIPHRQWTTKRIFLL